MIAGEVVNLLSVDCQKLQDAALFINFMWASPLQVGLAIFFLYQTIGWSVFVGKITINRSEVKYNRGGFLVIAHAIKCFFFSNTTGFGVLLVMLPLNAIIWTIMEKFQTEQMILKDERVRVITEILAGVKVLKLFSWEESFINKIGKTN